MTGGQWNFRHRPAVRERNDIHSTETRDADGRLPPHGIRPTAVPSAASICFVVSGAYAERMRAREQECPRHSMVFKPAGERHADEFGREGGTCLLIEVGAERLRTMEPVSDT